MQTLCSTSTDWLWLPCWYGPQKKKKGRKKDNNCELQERENVTSSEGKGVDFPVNFSFEAYENLGEVCLCVLGFRHFVLLFELDCGHTVFCPEFGFQ